VFKTRLALAASLIGLSLFVAGCQHHLIAAPGESTVSIYPDRQTYDKFVELKKQGSPLAQLARGFGQTFAVKKNVDAKSPVKIISSDDEGDIIEVTDGPDKGLTGFVPKNNVN
jgi:hypothetical protein